MSMSVLALDASLTETGYATDEKVGVLIPPPGVGKGIERVQWIRDRVLQLAQGKALIVLEGYAYGAKGNAVINIGELGGVLRLAFFERDMPLVEVPPASLKMFATGKGNASKEEVLVAAVRRLLYDGHNHNIADAMFLLEMARTQYGTGELTAQRVKALAKIAWPKLPNLNTIAGAA